MWDPRITVAVPEALLVPEQYLPSQLVRARRDSLICGEKALLLAVLEDAIRCLDTCTRSQIRAARDAERWVRADDHAWPFSFVNICAHLDIDVGCMRRALLARRARRVGPPQDPYRLHLRLKPPRRRLRLRPGFGELPRRAAQG
jgi:hypothetical protein